MITILESKEIRKNKVFIVGTVDGYRFRAISTNLSISDADAKLLLEAKVPVV